MFWHSAASRRGEAAAAQQQSDWKRGVFFPSLSARADMMCPFWGHLILSSCFCIADEEQTSSAMHIICCFLEEFISVNLCDK